MHEGCAVQRIDADRRNSRPRFTVRERRTGFDRRHPRPVLEALRERPAVLLATLVVLNALSMVDWLFTMNALDHGAREANTIMAGLIAMDPAAAAIFKAGVILAVSLAVWANRRFRLVLEVGVVGCAAFAMVVAYHLAFLAFLPPA